MDYLGHKKLEKNNGIYSSIDGIQEVSGSILLISTKTRKKHLKLQLDCFFYLLKGMRFLEARKVLSYCQFITNAL